MRTPVPHEPKPSPAIDIYTTIETMAVVTPKLAIASRSQTTSYSRLQKPDTTKNRKYRRIVVKLTFRPTSLNEPIPTISQRYHNSALYGFPAQLIVSPKIAM